MWVTSLGLAGEAGIFASRPFYPMFSGVPNGPLRLSPPQVHAAVHNSGDNNFGSQWGQTIGRYYIEAFLARYAGEIHGRVLEIGENTYTYRFGGKRVIQSDVLHVTRDNPRATIVADLTCADHIPSEVFDCVILTQTLQGIYDVRAAVRTVHRILKPGGVVLATGHGISKISSYDMQRWGEYWRLPRSRCTNSFWNSFLMIASLSKPMATYSRQLARCKG